MSLQPLKIPTGLLIFKDLRFRGIWINKWYDNATAAERMETFRPIFEMARRGVLKTKVEKAYPLSEVKAAVAHAAQGKRSGKIIFEFECSELRPHWTDDAPEHPPVERRNRYSGLICGEICRRIINGLHAEAI